MRWLLTGDRFDSAEALRLGLIQEVCEPGTQLDRGFALAERISEQAPLGIKATLRSAQNAMIEGEAAAGDRIRDELRALLGSSDAHEGMASYLERRPALFTGS